MCVYDGFLEKEKNVITKEIVKKTVCKFAILSFCFENFVYFPSNRPLAPHGSTSPVSETGNPISFEVVVPSKSLSAVLII